VAFAARSAVSRAGTIGKPRQLNGDEFRKITGNALAGIDLGPQDIFLRGNRWPVVPLSL
jgi:hypothetical protein